VFFTYQTGSQVEQIAHFQTIADNIFDNSHWQFDIHWNQYAMVILQTVTFLHPDFQWLV